MEKEYQVFFIVSHHDVLDNTIKYEISKDCKELYNFSERLSIKKVDKDGADFQVKVFSFFFKEGKKKKEQAEIILTGYGTAEFVGKIKYIPKKNNFIYDFSFDICHIDENDIKPPNSIKLTRNDQLKIYFELLKDKQFQKDELLFECLLEDSFNYLKEDNNHYYIDYYLSLLVNCHLKKNIIELLSYFDLNKVKLCEKVDEENFSSVLNKIKISPNIITQYLNEDKSEIDKYLDKFYTLLLYYRTNYMPDKVNELFNDDSKVNIYYQKILFLNKDSFNRVYLPNSFIDEMIQNDYEMNYENFILILKYLKKLENILIFLNKH
jgi:hypothetical protein